MDHATQVALLRRALAHLQAKTTDREAPSQRPVHVYTDPERYARELQMLQTVPRAVAHAAMLPAPGDFITHDAARPLLLVRHDDGRIAGMLNVCRHRGTRVELQARGNRTRFCCPYHGWTYGRDGRLAGVPHRRGFPQVDAATHSLRAVEVVETAGLLWVGGDPRLGPLAGELAGLGLGSGVVYRERVRQYALNWKLVFDIFLEAYHVRVAHADSIAPIFVDNVYLVDPHPPHLRNVFPKRTITALAEQDPSTWRLREHANLLYVLFPNTLVLVQPDHLSLVHVFPLAVDRTEVQSYTVIPTPIDSDKARAHWDANIDVLDSATEEDFAIGVCIQAHLRSGANETLSFGAFEHALTRFHAEVDAALS